jgi:hypothetical protein
MSGRFDPKEKGHHLHTQVALVSAGSLRRRTSIATISVSALPGRLINHHKQNISPEYDPAPAGTETVRRRIKGEPVPL